MSGMKSTPGQTSHCHCANRLHYIL